MHFTSILPLGFGRSASCGRGCYDFVIPSLGCLMSDSLPDPRVPVPPELPVDIPLKPVPGPKPKNKGGRPFKPRRVEVLGEGVLRAMRFVLKNDKEFDRHPDEYAMRNFLVKSPDRFISQLKELEAPTVVKSTRIDDEGQDRVERLIERFLGAMK